MWPRMRYHAHVAQGRLYVRKLESHGYAPRALYVDVRYSRWNVGRWEEGRWTLLGSVEFPGMVGSGEVLSVWGISAVPVASYVTYVERACVQRS